MGAMAFQITSFMIVYSTVHSGSDQRKHQSSASLAFVRGFHRWPVNSPHKWPVMRKMCPCDDVIMGSVLMLWNTSFDNPGIDGVDIFRLSCSLFCWSYDCLVTFNVCLLNVYASLTECYIDDWKIRINPKVHWHMRTSVSKAGVKDMENYIPQILWDVITCPCTWYLLLAHKSPNLNSWSYHPRPWAVLYIQYIPRNMHTVFALLCFVVVIHWLIFPYPSGLLHWHCGNLTIAPVPAKQPWWIWINISC